MASARTYWNPFLETLPPEKLAALQLKKFQRALAYAYTHSPFYRQKLGRAGIQPEEIRSYEDILKIPTTTKSELQAAQTESDSIYGSLCCLPSEEIAVYHQTSGTTGHPIRQADSRRDWEWWAECWATLLWAQGFRPPDRMIIPFSYGVFVAFWAGHYACEKIGCEVIPAGGLSSEARIDKMRELKASAIMCTPTYALHLAEVAKTMSLDPVNDLHIEKIVCAGEPGALIPATKVRIESEWGASVFDHAGATEAGAWGFECIAQSGGLHVNEAFFLVELLDPETKQPVLPDEEGELVITPLDREAQPVIRFELRDRALWSKELCSCGRSYRLLDGGLRGRSDQLVKVRGVLFSPTTVESVVRQFDNLGNEYQVIVEREHELDKVTVQVELLSGGASDRMHTELEQQLRIATGLRCHVELKPLGTLPRYEVKAKRFIDRREHDE